MLFLNKINILFDYFKCLRGFYSSELFCNISLLKAFRFNAHLIKVAPVALAAAINAPLLRPVPQALPQLSAIILQMDAPIIFGIKLVVVRLANLHLLAKQQQ